MENKKSAFSGAPRAKMPVEQRAKQFMPFAAVTGLDEAIRRVEHEFEMNDRRDLSEEAIMALEEVDKYD